MITEQQISEWRKLRGEGMTSAVGEYTPKEFWEILDEIEEEKEKFRIAVIHAAEYKAWVEKAESELAIERRALELACNKLFIEGVIIEEDTDEPVIQPSPDHFRKRAKLTV